LFYLLSEKSLRKPGTRFLSNKVLNLLFHMQNLGNTCYFNTALQCMLHVPVLTNHFIINGYDGTCVFTQEYKNMVDHIWVHKKKEALNPSKMLQDFRSRYPQFRGSEPNDVQETILCIIDIFESSLDKDWVKKHFYGEMTTRITGKEPATDIFSCHTIDIGEDFFTKSTMIDNNPEYQMESTITKKGTVFMINFNLYKEKQLIDLPERFEGYKLCGAALHLGSHRGGHYAALVRHRDEWFICDDEIKIKVDHYNEKGPYYFAMYTKSSN